MDYLIASTIIFLMYQLFTNPKYLYVKEDKPTNGTPTDISTESTTPGADSGSEGEEKTIFHPGLWL